MGKHNKMVTTAAAPQQTEQVATAPAPVAATPQARASANGWTFPKVGGICWNIWTEAQRIHNTGVVPTLAMLRAWGVPLGLNPITTQIQLYRYRAFAGLRAAKPITVPVSTVKGCGFTA